MKYAPVIIIILTISAVLVGIFAMRSITSSSLSHITTSSSPADIYVPPAFPERSIETPKKSVITNPTSLNTIPSHPNTPLPPSIVLDDIQFASQAPLKNWGMPYQEFCEETSSLIAAYYALGKKIPSAQEISDEQMKIKSFEEQRFGYYQDTTTQETSVILKEFYQLKHVSIINNPTLDDLKRLLNQGNAILVPSAGRMLGNPYFSGEGPLYHMIVLKGYTASGSFITQDPGTNSKGKDYHYSFETIMTAMHDWNNGDVNNGAKVIIAVGKE